MSNPEFRAAVQQPDEQIDLAQAALLFARDVYPELDVRRYLNQFDEWAAEARSVLHDSADPVTALNGFLFGQLHFIGNQLFYYDPLNSYLNKTIDRRVGLPITLSVIYLEVARRLNLPVAGIGLPGHFVVRYTCEADVRYIDPFHQGRFLQEEDCRSLVRELSDGQMQLEAWMLEPVGPRQILARMLNNLKNAYLHQNDFEAAVQPVERLIDLQPDEPLHIRDIGLLEYQLNHYREALQHLNQYLVLGNVGADDPVREIIGNIQTDLAHLN